MGVSHATARKAVQRLLNEGLLCRMENGRLAVRRTDSEDRRVNPQFCLLAPAWESSEVNTWQLALTKLAVRMQCSVRTVRYAHWDDPLLLSSLERFDGAFFMPVPQAMPDHFLSDLLEIKRPVVVLGADWTEHGIPSMRLYAPVLVQKLLDHLTSLGHSRIDYFNVQPNDPILAARLAQWNIWRASRRIGGELIDEPVPAFTETISAAYQAIDRRIRAGRFDTTAMLCTTERVAAGTMRAMADHGLRPGHDVAVCTFDSAGRAEYSIPSLTSLESLDPQPYVAVCLEWMLEGMSRQWRGPLMVQPENVGLAIRQSTVPDIDQKQPPARERYAAESRDSAKPPFTHHRTAKTEGMK